MDGGEMRLSNSSDEGWGNWRLRSMDGEWRFFWMGWEDGGRRRVRGKEGVKTYSICNFVNAAMPKLSSLRLAGLPSVSVVLIRNVRATSCLFVREMRFEILASVSLSFSGAREERVKMRMRRRVACGEVGGP